MDEQLTFVHLLWVEVTRAREQQLLRALRAAPGFTDVELTEWDPTQTWFRATLPAQEHILEAAIAALLSIEGFSVEIQGAMHGPIHAIVFNAVPGQTTRPRRIWRQYDRRLPRERVSVPVSMAWAIPIPSRQAAPVAPAPQPDVAVTAGVPVARPEPVVRAGVPVARTEAAVPAGVPLARTEVVSRDRLGRVAERPGGSVAERAVTAGLAGWRPRLAVAELFRSGVKDERVSRLAAALSPALLVFLVTYQAALRRVFEGGPFPSSTDAMGHLYRVFYVAQEWKQWRLIPQWTPGWYMGTPLLEFYPPLTTFVMAPVAALGDPALSYRVFVFVAMSLAAVLTTVLFRNRLGTAGAITAGILYSLAPFVLRTVFSDGVLPLALFIVIQPVLVRLLLDVFERPTAKRFLLASLGSAAMVLTHHLQALMFFVCIGAGIALAAAVHRRGVDRPVLVVASVIIGLMLAGIWLLPAMAPLHLADTPNRGDVGLPLTHSRGLSVFSPGERESPGAGPYLGLALIGVGIAGAAMTRRRPLSIVMVGAAAVALFMTFGMKNPVISSLPPLQTFVFFERFLLIASLSLALLTGLFVQALASHMETRFRLPRAALFLTVAVLAVGLADARPSFALVRQTDHNAWVLSSTILDREAPPGRLADFTGRSEASYFPAIAGRDSAYGSSIEGTPHAQDIRLLSEAIGRGHVGFTNRQLRQWWVTGAYVLPDDSFVSPVLETAGFARAEATGGATPWIRRDDASVANLLSRNAVIVGRAHRHAGVVFPWASRTRAGDYAELTDDVLLDNDMVVLAEAPDPIPDAVQSRLTAFQQRGGVILALLGNNPGVWRADMQLKRQRFSSTMMVIDKSGRVLESPLEVRGWEVGGSPWEALAVDDARAETILAFMDESGVEFPLLSRLNTQDGPVYLVGGGVFAFGFAHPDEPLIPAIEAALRREIPQLVLHNGLQPLPATVVNQNSGGMDITVDAGDGSRPVLLSVTAAPHWKSITVNGRRMQSRNHEGLILLDLPPGLALVELRQGPPPGVWGGAALSMLGIAALGGAVLRWSWITGPLATTVRERSVAVATLSFTPRLLEMVFGSAAPPRDDAGPRNGRRRSDHPDDDRPAPGGSAEGGRPRPPGSPE